MIYGQNDVMRSGIMDDKPENQDLPEGKNGETTEEAAGTARPDEDFETLYQESLENPEEGEIIHGVVIKVLKEYVAVNINRKSEGMLPLTDLTEEERETLSPGNPLDVMVERYDSTQGFVLLSREKVLRARIWDDLQKAHDEGTPVQGTIVAKVKGGFTVDVGGVKAFLPGSQVDIRPVRDNEAVINLQGTVTHLKHSG